MLNISGINRFYYLENFHDMRCKYERVLSIIHSQFNREPESDEIFIIMSKDQRKVRLFNYDCISCSFYEKRISNDYRFMKVRYEGGKPVFSMEWKDVVLLLENPSKKSLIIR